MGKTNEEPKTLQFVRELCKGCSEMEIMEAEQNFREYLKVVRNICNRLEREGEDLVVLDE